ncbi:MAG TPA: arylsulfatase, partial [Cytophaga sp.]|nr:arylsulfatase [Cytophaga sp.]
YMNLLMLQKNKKILAVLITALTSALLIAQSGFSLKSQSIRTTHKTDDRPNIVVILVDDMGFSDLGCFGSEITTPNLDKLAAEGMILNNFYNCGRCCPSRASLLTGLYPHQAGVGDMLQAKGNTPAYQGYLSDSSVTIAQLLKQSGYHTITSGKWHVGLEPSAMACQRGFDKSFTMLNNGSSYYKNGPLYNDGRTVTFMEGCNPIQRDSNYYLTQNITDFAVKAIDEQKNNTNPFFLYVTYTAPHWPIQAIEEDIKKYHGTYLKGWDKIREERYQKQLRKNLITASTKLSPRYEKAVAWNDIPEKDKNMWDMRMSIYAAMIDRMDKGVGEILKKLKETGEDKNTLIIFMSDNGGSADAVRDLSYVIQRNGKPGSGDNIDSYYPNWGNVSNTPFRLFKRNVHEGGIASPFIAWYPKVIKPGSSNTAVAHVMDILPTCLEAAQTSYPTIFNGKTIKPTEGISLFNTFKGDRRDVHEKLFWEHEGNKAVRSGNWKLVYELEYGKWELYNLATDRSETNDLAATYPEEVKRLQALHDQWSKHVGVEDWLKIK